jgi:hypothetical protein
MGGIGRVWGASVVVVVCAVGIAAMTACVGDEPAPAAEVPDGGDDGIAPGTPPGAPPGTDGGGDGAPGSCTTADSTCQGTTLHACRANGSGFDDQTCTLGCAAAPSAHCKIPVPSANGPVAGDLDGTGLGPLVIAINTTINSDTGEITGLRTANASPTTREVISGVAFHVVPIPGTASAKIGVFSFGDLSVGDGKTVVLQGANAVALVSAKDVKILGLLDARGTCVGGAGGPGGGAGGTIASPALGQGHGTAGASNASDATSGGGGGGFGDNGGNTSQVGVGGTTLGGAPYGTAALVPLLGGSGGGRGGDINSATTTGGIGGGGGGALQIVAAGQVLVGAGSSLGGINAGGCGGTGAIIPNTNTAGAGGGGGSGGSILIEGGTVTLDSFAFVGVNGGSAGGGATGANAVGGAGKSGQPTLDQTTTAAIYYGGAAGAACGHGGEGGSSSATPAITKGANGQTGGTGGCTGGGGGGAGRLRINSISGAATVVTGAVTSPRLGDTSSHAEILATQGMLLTQ